MRDPLPPLVLLRGERRTVFVYAGVPAGETLVFALCPEGEASDPFGNSCSRGQWTAAGYEADSAPIEGSAAVAHGVFLRRVDVQPPRAPELARIPPPPAPVERKRHPVRLRDIFAWR